MAWSYELLLFFKGFLKLNNQLSVIFSRWYSRLTQVLFHDIVRVRPGIICSGQDAMEQERSWSPRRIIRTSIYPLL